MAGENVGAIYYTVEANTEKLLAATGPADKSLDNLNKTFSKTDKAANQANFQMTKTAAAVKNMGSESQAATRNLSGLYGALAGLVSLRAAGSLIDMADAYNEMAERISMATSSQDEYEHVQKRLLDTANRTYRSLSEAQELYVLTASTLRGLGYDTDQSMDVVDGLSFAFVKNATAADRAKTAVNAVTKSLNKGKVDSENWQTILAAIPTVVDDLAAATGLATTEILRMGVEGKITGKMLSETLRTSMEANRAAADDMATTVKDAFTNIRNNLSVFIGEANRSSGATQLLSGALVLLGENIDTVAKLLIVAGSGALARYIAQLGASVIASGRAMLAARAQAAEELRLAQAHMAATQAALAQATATSGLTAAHGRAAAAATAHAAAVARMQAAQAAAVGVGRTLLGVLGGPVGIIALLASAAVSVVAFGDGSRGASAGVDTLKTSVDLLTVSLKEMGQSMLTNTKIKIGDEFEALGKTAAVTKLQIESLGSQLAAMPVTSPLREGLHRDMMQLAADYEGTTDRMAKLLLKQEEIDAQLNEISKRGAAGAAQESDPEVAKRLQAMRDQIELAKLEGAARARLGAIQKLGANATAEERAEAERLATTLYELERAQKGSTAATKESVSGTKENAKAIAEMQQQLVYAGMSGRELAEAKAAAQLNKFATPEEIAQVKDLAAALWEIQQAKADKAIVNQADPIKAELDRYQTQLVAYQDMRDRMAITDQQYFDYRQQAEEAHAETMRELQEERFKQESEWNALLMEGIDAFSEGATNALAGIVVGTANAADAARAFAGTILKEVIGSFVKMGIAHVKAVILGRAAETAAGAAYAAATAAQVHATTALASQAAFASTAAIPIVGPSLAPAAAAAAAVAAGALGAPAIASSVLAGQRQYGGPVAADGLYRINETGAPEILNLANGRQYMLPNQRGEVVSNRDATVQAGQAQSGGSSTQIIRPEITVALNGSWFSASDIRRLVGDINEAVKDGMTIRVKN